MNNYTPNISTQEIERIIQREFSFEDFERVSSILAKYGGNSDERGRNRVHAAAMKLADGDVEQLSHVIEAANADYRDVLAWAEYPSQMKLGFDTEKDAMRDALNSDKDQYQAWLSKS